MTEETTAAPVSVDQSGNHVARVSMTPTQDTKRVHVVAPPDVVVPVVFIPGIMGSNLRNKQSKESVWNVSSTGSLARQWILAGSKSRQKRLVPAEVEVDDGGVFPGASATVPDAVAAKKRGWGTVSKAFYGEILIYLDNMMNGNSPPHWSMLTALCEDERWGRGWGAEKPYQPLHGTEANYAFNFYCPVHAIGYNWLQDNRQSGIDIVHGVSSGSEKVVEGIDDIIDFYASQKRPDGSSRYRCTQVILVTHSMGGLVARAAIHPQMGNAQSKVLGIIHGEQPANGAAAAYHHARAGNDGAASLVLGWDAAQVTATFANSPGALELLPNQQYPAGWLKAASPDNPKLLSKPNSDPYLEIYQHRDLWYRVVDPTLIDPAGLHAAAGADPWIAYIQNLRLARDFHFTLKTNYHPITYVHYGADKEQLAYGDIVWQAEQTLKVSPAEVEKATIPAGATSNPVSLDGKNWFGWNVPMSFSISPPEEPGDATVPQRSASAPGRAGVAQSFRMKGFEHSASYGNIDVQLATLYSIAKILNKAKLD